MCRNAVICNNIICEWNFILVLPFFLRSACGFSFVQWNIIDLLLPFVTSAITAIDHPECLSILAELLDIWVFVNPTSLPLAAKEFLKRVLADSLAQKALYVRESEQVLYHVNE